MLSEACGLPVDNVVLVEVLESQENLAPVKLGSVFAKALVLLDMHHQIASLHVFHDKVETSICLEAGVQRRQEGMALLVGHLVDSLFRTSTRVIKE